MRETTYSGAGVFDRPLSDYEKVFRPLLNEKGFLETLETIPGRKHLVLDLMTSGFNLTDFLGKEEIYRNNHKIFTQTILGGITIHKTTDRKRAISLKAVNETA